MNDVLVLIVDDKNDFPKVIGPALEAAGFRTARASNRDEAVAQAEKLRPALVLMDINMPGVSGTQALLDIRENPATRDIKVAFLTGAKDPWPALEGDSPDVAELLGADGFLEKTEPLEVLIEKIKGIIGPAA